MTARLQAIDTVYNRYRFRSRLEARWAVFFDTLGIHYEYEKEGYHLPSGPYLCDFWLPQFDVWAEVKPLPFTFIQRLRCEHLLRATKHPVMLLVGMPDFIEYDMLVYAPGEGILALPHTIGLEYLHERRFFCMGYPDGPEDFDDEYHRAVDAAYQARFDRG